MVCGVFVFRKFAKFILVLIPLFGIMYIVLFIAFPAHHVESGEFNVVYLYIEMGYNSFQVTVDLQSCSDVTFVFLLLLFTVVLSQWDFSHEKLGFCFSRGKPASSESRYPTQDACWMF